MTQDDLAETVAAEYGGEPLSGTTVGRWLRYQDDKGSEPSSFALTAALARVLEVTAGWLAFGEGEMTAMGSAPGDAPTQKGGPTPSEVLDRTAQKLRDAASGGESQREAG